MNRLLLLALLAGTAIACGDRLTAVPDSTCESAADCNDYTSCAWRQGGCECRDSVCYVDPDAPFDEELGCRGCHGSLDNAAPPVSIAGGTATTELAVGAHQAHLRGSVLSAVVSCGDCHVVPGSVNAEGHIDDTPGAEVVFSELATGGGAVEARWDPGTGTCLTYCHGVTLGGGTNTEPVWTVVDGTQAACGTCHGAPPDGSHPNDNSCEHCHDPTAGPNRTIASSATHIDGVLQLTGGHCGACHGDDSRSEPLNAAPPRDLAGNEASDKVGAHLAHLVPGDAADVPCQSCHRVPQEYGDPGHDDDGDETAEVTFWGRAIAAAPPAPSYDPAALRCSDTYCHGVTLAGGSNGDQVEWTGTGDERDCDACHGLPPATEGHVAAGVTAADPCGACHPDSASSTAAATITDRQYHVDGALQVSGCGSTCHEVPPVLGAHAQHAGTLGFECATCHGHNGSGPTHDEDPGHVVRPENIDIAFSPRAFPGGTTIGNGGSPSYDPATGRCAVGCHNPVPGNPDETPNLANRPTWSAGAIECGSCHDEIGDAPPLSHAVGSPDRNGCQFCHDQRDHMLGIVRLADQDPTDGFVPTLGTIDPQCKGCHDGGGGSFFGGASPRNVLAGWDASSHGGEGYGCNDCHTYHVSTTNTTQRFVDPGVNKCTASGCHSAMVTPPSGPFTYAGSHHPVGETSPDELRCVHCHNPHLAKAPPYAASSPDDKWTLFNYPTTAASSTISGGVSTRGFCLACHDGAPPPGVPTTALNIQQALSGGSDPSQFRRDAQSLHRQEHNRYNCVTCHDWHGSEGTSGIDRGRTLMPFITVNQFPYTGESSCGTPSRGSGSLGRYFNGTWINYGFGCH